MRFADPYLLILLLIVPFLFIFVSKGASFRFSSLTKIKGLRRIEALGKGSFSFIKYLPVILRALAIILIVLAIARPQAGKKQMEIISEGVDIILTLDTSGSMDAMDFTIDGDRVTRLDAVKDVVAKFIEKRPGDRIGMVVFGDEAFTQAPLTLDHELLLTLLKELHIGMAGNATAVGSAMGVSINRIKDLKAKSKIVILLTDGRNNAGQLAPSVAAEIAKAYNIKIYTIGVGSNAPAPFMVDTVFGKKVVYERVDLDEETLKMIADTTNAKYFRATDTKKLETIYSEIDKMEKTEAKVKEYMNYNELFFWFLVPGILILLVEIILTRTRFMKIP